MKDIMMMEKIEHEEAKKAAEGTKYDWMDLLDFEALRELKRRLYFADEEECREKFRAYFENLIRDLKYYDEDEEDEASRFDEMTESEYCDTVREYASQYTCLPGKTDEESVRLDFEACIKDGGDGFLETLTESQFNAFVASVMREINAQ